MELEALSVLERLILEDDESVEAWYLGGWCLHLIAEKERQQNAAAERTAENEPPQSNRNDSLVASREWLRQSLRLHNKIEYEDERLKEHAIELIQELNQELGEDMDDESNSELENLGLGEEEEEEEGWDEEIEIGSNEEEDDDDHEMHDS